MRELKNQMLGTMEPPLMQLSVNIFQSELLAVKFAMGYEQNMSFLVIPNLQKFDKKLKILGWAPLIH